MPIQVVSTYVKLPSAPLKLISAGEDSFPVCDTIIILTATVDILTNLQGHTVIWEQLSGTQVTLINDDQLTVSYSQLLLDETDKEFKITIDKGTTAEQSDTVIVYSTPTTLASTSFPVSATAVTPADPIENMQVVASAAFPPHGGVTNPEVATTPSFLITWDLPSDAVIQSSVSQMTLLENNVPVSTYTLGDVLEYQGSPSNYTVLTEYVIAGQPSSILSRLVDFSATTIPAVHVVDDITAGSLAQSSVTISKFPNVVMNSQDQQLAAFPPSTGIVTRFINTTINTNTADEQPSGFSQGFSTITRTDPGGIGGG